MNRATLGGVAAIGAAGGGFGIVAWAGDTAWREAAIAIVTLGALATGLALGLLERKRH